MTKQGPRALGIGAALLALCACSAPDPGPGPTWEWRPGAETPAPRSEPVYSYPEPGEFVIGPGAAVVRFTALRPDVLVRASPEAGEWVFTPAELEVVEPGDSGLERGGTLELAIPGGVAEGVQHAGVWVFDKAEIDPDSRYLVSWSELEHPGVELGSALDYLYEVRDDAHALVRLQDPPGVGWTRETFDVRTLLEQGGAPQVLVTVVPTGGG